MSRPQSASAAAYLRSRAGKICVALKGTTIESLVEQAESALAHSQFLEFRLDTVADFRSQGKHHPNPRTVLQPIAEFLAAHKEVAAIATCRRRDWGGYFSGTWAEELEILAIAAEIGFAILDIEIEAIELCGPTALLGLREICSASGASLLISFHDFEGTTDPEGIFSRIQPFKPDFIKVVNTAHKLTDGLKMLQWMARNSGDARLVGISMGESGVVSRVLSLRAGSAFTFASATDGSGTAAGQMTADVLRDFYRIEQLDQATRIYGVVGNPVAHSLSPLMQNSAFRRERVNSVYLPLMTESIEDLLTVARELPLSGFSITMPFKQAILPYLANMDPMSAKLGACNTVRIGADGKLYGFNTDVAGVVHPLERRLALKGAKILVLGAGGAARAAVYGLADKGAKVFVWSRNEKSAVELAAAAGANTIGREEIAKTGFDVLINATPCGMRGNPHSLPLDEGGWQASLVFDLVYNPLETPLIEVARSRRIPVVQGVEMFVLQGARQFEIWTGKPAPEGEMLRMVLFALKKGQMKTAAVQP